MDVDNEMEDADPVELAVEIFRLLADATRVRLLVALGAASGDGELSVTDLSAAVDKRPGAVSQHLAKLRMARLVTTRRSGTQVLYRVANEHVSQMVADALRHSEHLGTGVPAHHRVADRKGPASTGRGRRRRPLPRQPDGPGPSSGRAR